MSMNRDNFRANQPPSKVLHIRNLPPDVTEQEVVDLCKPYGRIMKIKLNAGQSRNQCFVEFEHVNCAIQMIYSFVGSADPPKVRNKTVYLQYSTRQEIGSGHWGEGSGAGHQGSGCVILVIMDNIQVSLGPNLDTLHLLCSAFGEVAKIAVFEKTTGLQALVQFKNPQHAREAQQTLDGTSIPEHLVPQHPGKVTMKVSYSAHSDLQIRSQSERTLHTLFSTYGQVQKIAISEHNSKYTALVQYPDDATAVYARQYLDGHSMYPGGSNTVSMAAVAAAAVGWKKGSGRMDYEHAHNEAIRIANEVLGDGHINSGSQRIMVPRQQHRMPLPPPAAGMYAGPPQMPQYGMPPPAAGPYPSAAAGYNGAPPGYGAPPAGYQPDYPPAGYGYPPGHEYPPAGGGYPAPYGY
eukprot:gene3208-3485_t